MWGFFGVSVEIKVSIRDASLLLQHDWRVYDRYVRSGPLLLHRLIMGAERGQIVDHKDGNTLNNTRENLRFCTHAQNMQNSKTRSHSGTGVKGVQKHKLRYRARIRIGGKQVTLGNYFTLQEAKDAYDKAALAQFGEFARLY